MAPSHKSAIVTGAYGAIGRQVSRTLADEGWHVTGVGHGQWSDASVREWGLQTWHEGSISIDTLTRLAVRADLIVHCAGSSAVGASLTEPYKDFERTVGSTAAVLEFIRLNCPDAVLVYPSSAAVYGLADQLPITENSVLQPASPYGVHKRCAEDLIAGYARLFRIRSAIVRLFSIYGEHFRKQLLWDACNRICNGDTVFFGTGFETRDFLHVSDAARLIAIAATYASATCPVVNGGGGMATSVRHVLNRLFELLGQNGKPEFAGTQRAGDPRDYQADITAAAQWGWSPTVSLDDGLRRYVSWYKREGGTDEA